MIFHIFPKNRKYKPKNKSSNSHLFHNFLKCVIIFSCQSHASLSASSSTKKRNICASVCGVCFVRVLRILNYCSWITIRSWRRVATCASNFRRFWRMSGYSFCPARAIIRRGTIGSSLKCRVRFTFVRVGT